MEATVMGAMATIWGCDDCDDGSDSDDGDNLRLLIDNFMHGKWDGRKEY